MGMSIDNCINDLLIQREDFTYELTSEEIDFMIATMRKYQKIEQIVQACGADYNSMDSYECVEEIARILIHGNDD